MIFVVLFFRYASVNNNNKKNQDTVYGAVIMTQSHSESSPSSRDDAEQRQMAADLRTKLVDFTGPPVGC